VVKALTILFVLLFGLTPAVAKKIGKPAVKLSLSKEVVWQREPVTVTLEVVSNDTLSRLDSKKFEQDGFTILAYEQQIKEEKNKQILRLKWAVFPLMLDNNTKKVEILLPRIRYRPSSGRPITLDLKALSLTVKPLPLYVPPPMPVGKVSLQSEWNHGRFIYSKKLFNWSVISKSLNVAPQTLPALSRYFKNTEELTFLPFRKSSKIEKKQQGINTHQHYQIPIKAVAVGRLNLPNIAVQYFNPETGLIEKTSISIPVVMVINHWLLAILGFALLLLLAFVWLKAISRVKGILKRRTQIKQALQALKSANSYSKIQSALMQYALAKKGKNNISLGQFVKSCDLNKKDQLALEALIEKLQLSEFSLRENKQSTKIAADLFEILH